MTVGSIMLTFLGLLAAGGLLYGASRLVKRLDQQDRPSSGKDRD